MVYTLHLVPEDGPCLPADTKREWQVGRSFKVVASNFIWKRNSYITLQDVEEQEYYHGVSFNITFETVSVERFFEQRAEDCYASDLALNLLRKEMVE